MRDWPLAIATTAGVSAVATAAVVALGFATFCAPPSGWAQNVVALCITGPILAFAEEIGWRGYPATTATATEPSCRVCSPAR